MRHAACTEHRPACDCREAEHREVINELRAALREVDEAALEVLAGHHPYAWRRNPLTGEDESVHCMCTGCKIARAGHLSAAWLAPKARL